MRRSAVAVFVATIAFFANTPDARSQQVITIAPSNPTINNCIPLGNGGSLWAPFAAFFYQNVPAFTLSPGDILAFDLGNPNDVLMQMDIAMARTTVNGGIQQAQSFVTVVTNTQSPSSLGDNSVGTFEVQYTVGATFTFPGGGLIIRFGNPSAVYQLDTSCTTVLVQAYFFDPSGFFVLRAYGDADGVFPWDQSDNGAIGGFRVIIAVPVELMNFQVQ